jgi:hypothetical protein
MKKETLRDIPLPDHFACSSSSLRGAVGFAEIHVFLPFS